MPEPFRWVADERGPLAAAWDAAPRGVRVRFTTRVGGVSEGSFSSLNLGALTDDVRERVAENRRRAVASAGGDPARATMQWQVHGTDVREVGERPAPGIFLRPGAEAFPKGDGLVTSLAGRPLVLLTADCLPVALARADGGRLAVLHAGWRGIVGGILENGVRAVGDRVVAAVGPGAGPCCYEVREDVAGPLRERFGDDVVRDGRADLPLCAERSLLAAGAGRVDVLRACTMCDPQRFFSHRRDRGRTGRQGVVGVLADA